MSEKRVVRLHQTTMPERELSVSLRAAVWRLIPQLRYRQFPRGGRAPVAWLHRSHCHSYTGGKCDCSPICELALAGLN